MEYLRNLPYEELFRKPAAYPPPGETYDFDDPHSNGYQFLVIASIFQVIMYLISGSRFYIELKTNRPLTFDNYTCFVAVVGTTAYYITGCLGVTIGGFGTNGWNVPAAFLLSNRFIILLFLSNILTGFAWLFAKWTFFILYLRIFRPKRYLTYAIWFGLVLNVALHVALIVYSLVVVAPHSGQTWQESFLDPEFDGIYNINYIYMNNLVLDVYILIIPIIGLWDLQMTLKRKLGVMAIFATGILACIASSLGIYYRYLLMEERVDILSQLLPIVIIAHAEMCIGISASCMPSLSKFVAYVRRRWREQHATRPWFKSTSAVSLSRSATIKEEQLRPCGLGHEFGRHGFCTNVEAQNSLKANRFNPLRSFGGKDEESASDNDAEQGIRLNYAVEQEFHRASFFSGKNVI